MSRAALARLRRLPPEAQALARAVVILGDGAEPATAAEFAGLDTATAGHAAEALDRAAILSGGSDPPEAPTAQSEICGPSRGVRGVRPP